MVMSIDMFICMHPSSDEAKTLQDGNQLTGTLIVMLHPTFLVLMHLSSSQVYVRNLCNAEIAQTFVKQPQDVINYHRKKRHHLK